jgi:hypothetical protein
MANEAQKERITKVALSGSGYLRKLITDKLVKSQLRPFVFIRPSERDAVKKEKHSGIIRYIEETPSLQFPDNVQALVLAREEGYSPDGIKVITQTTRAFVVRDDITIK